MADFDVNAALKALEDQEDSTEEFDIEAALAGLEEDDDDEPTMSSAISDISSGSIYRAPPATDDYDQFPVGNRTDSRDQRLEKEKSTGEEQPITAWEIYNDLVATDEEGGFKNPNVRRTAGMNVYDDPATGRTYRIPIPGSQWTSKLPLGGVLDWMYEKVAPDAYANDKADTNIFNTISNEVIDSSLNLLELGAAGVDVAADKAGYDTNLAKGTKKLARQSTGSSTQDALIGEGGALMLSFFTGQGIVKGGAKAVEKGSKFVLSPLTNTKVFQEIGVPVLKEFAPTTNRILQFDPIKIAGAIGGEAGIAAGSDTNTQTLAFGANSLYNNLKNPDSLQVLGVDPKEDYAENVIAARTNILLDSLLASGVVVGGVKGTQQAIKFLNEATLGPILRSVVGDEAGRQKDQVAGILDELSRIEAASTKETVEEVRDRLIQIIKTNQDVVLDMMNRGDETKTLFNDVFSALEQGENLAPATLAKVRQYRKGIINDPKSDGNTLATMSDFGKGAVDYLDETSEDVLTNGRTIDDAVDVVVGTGNQRISDASDNIAGIEAQRLQAEQDLVTMMTQDPDFGQRISKIAGLSPSQLTASSSGSKEAIAKAVIQNLDTAVTQKNELYDAIPEGSGFDVEAFGELISRITQPSNSFDDTGKELVGNRLISTINEAFNTKISVDDPLGAVDGEIPQIQSSAPMEQITTDILNSGADFRVLYKDLRPRISQMISEAYNGGRVGVAERLREVKNFIDEQVDWVADNTDDPAAADAARRASAYYKQYADRYKDEPILRVVDAYEATSGGKTGQRQLLNASMNDVTGVLEGDIGVNVQALADILTEQGSPVDPTAISEYTAAKVFESIYRQVRNDGLSGVDVNALEDQIIKYSDNLRSQDEMLAAQLDSLANKIRTAKSRGVSVEQELASAEEQFELMKNDAFSNLVAPFLDKFSDGAIKSANSTDKLITSLKGANGADIARSILTNTDNNEIVQEGLESAWLKGLRDQIITSKEDIMGTPVMSAAKIGNVFSDEGRGYLNTGKIIMANNPKLNTAITEYLRIMESVAQGRVAQVNPATSGTAEIQQYTAAVNRMIYLTFGALSRGGAKARAGAGFVAEKLDFKNVGPQALDFIAADTKEFLRIADKIVEESKSMGVGIGGFEIGRISKDTLNALFEAGVRAGLYAETDEDKEKAFTVWDTMLSAEQGAEKAVDYLNPFD